ncbi:MAG: hypothetical protein ACRDGQ_10870, partial [Candidatus Limnocylindrales bacterium]
MTLPDDDQIKAMLEARSSQDPGDPLPEVILERVLAAGPAPASVPGWRRLGLTMAAGLIVAVGAGLFLSGRLAGPGQPAHTGPPQTSSPA